MQARHTICTRHGCAFVRSPFGRTSYVSSVWGNSTGVLHIERPTADWFKHWARYVALPIALAVSVPAAAHDSHAQHHAFYHGWVNKNDKGCCNDKDCRELAETDEREVGGALFVFVRGVGVAKGQAAWCPVLRHHYLRAGNVPNAAVSHACVTDFYKAETPCEQLVCYQPRPLF